MSAHCSVQTRINPAAFRAGGASIPIDRQPGGSNPPALIGAAGRAPRPPSSALSRPGTAWLCVADSEMWRGLQAVVLHGYMPGNPWADISAFREPSAGSEHCWAALDR